MLEGRVAFEFVQHPRELLLRGDDDRLAIVEETRQVVGMLRDAHHVFQVREIRDVLADVRVERFAVGEDEGDVHQLVARAGFEEAVQTVGEPANRECFAAAGRVLREVFASDVAGGGEVSRNVRRDFPHQASLMVARENRERETFRLVVLRFAFGDANQEK